jgi:DNA adenine methylase
MDKIKRPAIYYYGAKFRCAERIIEHFPMHNIYVEPFGGSAALLLRKTPAKCDVYNDLYSEVYDFFQCLRKYPRTLIRQLMLSPHSREEFEACLVTNESDDLTERCRKFYVKSWQSLKCGGRFTKNSDWRYFRKSSNTRLNADCDNLWQIALRLKQVTLEHVDAIDCIKRYDTIDTLFYIDPPYAEQCGASYITNIDMTYHTELSKLLHTVRGLVIVSAVGGTYDKLYKDWLCKPISIKTMSTQSKPELLYMNFELK